MKRKILFAFLLVAASGGIPAASITPAAPSPVPIPYPAATATSHPTAQPTPFAYSLMLSLLLAPYGL